MRTVSLAFGLWVAALAFGSSALAAPGVGDAAPAFVLQGSDGALYALEDFVGTRAVVLAWFPKAFTAG
jgi:peroxiredoxin Q/BCP